MKDLGVEFSANANLRENGATLRTNWSGSTYGGVDQSVAIAIQRDAAIKAGIGQFDGLGFTWNGKGYDMVQDHYDETRCSGAIAKLRQRYALQEVRRQARTKGYGVQENVQSDGTIRLTLTRR